MELLLANTVFVFPAFFIAGWLGLAAALATELAMLWGYLRKRSRFRWVFKTFLAANLISTLVGVPILVTRAYFPNSEVYNNLASLWIGVSVAFVVTVFVEYGYFRWRSRVSELHELDRRQLFRAVFMANFASYTVILSLHLAMT